MKVKVCGLTTYEDAALALDEGVDALGFNFYPRSPRHIGLSEAREIVRRLPPFAATVGIFVNVERPAEVDEAGRSAGVRILQLHGDEPPDYCRGLDRWTVIKAVRVGRDFKAEDLSAYDVQAFLLDARNDVLFGGTGRNFDWSLAGGIGTLRPVILAGGLHAGNVGEAIRTVRPYAVDVCSGVESEPGRKDPAKLREFMQEVRNVTQNP